MKLSDGLIIAEFKKGLEFTMDLAKEMVDERLKLQNGKDYPLILIANGFKVESREVREYLKKEGIQGMKSGCFVVENFFEKVMVNFFLFVNPPKIPSKMFTSLEEAIEWSAKYK